MKKTVLFIISIIACFTLQATTKQHNNKVDTVKQLYAAQAELKTNVSNLTKEVSQSQATIRQLQQQNASLARQVDSLKSVTNQQANKHDTLQSKLSQTDKGLAANEQVMASRTHWGIAITIAIILILVIIVFIIQKRMKKGDTTITEVKQTQSALQTAQAKLQEDSIKLDNELLQIMQKQLETNKPKPTVPDNSLIIKIANEIARIETNLSKMDKSVKGYKQLVQAKDRMINSIKAYGYEIISLIGQDYNDGMQFPTRFVPDDSLPEGKRIITGMVKMQINYNGKMIQPAEIVVSQNI